jgi:hypothetical protein
MRIAPLGATTKRLQIPVGELRVRVRVPGYWFRVKNWKMKIEIGNTGYWQHSPSPTNPQICIASIGKVKKLYFRQCKREMENQH